MLVPLEIAITPLFIMVAVAMKGVFTAALLPIKLVVTPVIDKSGVAAYLVVVKFLVELQLA